MMGAWAREKHSAVDGEMQVKLREMQEIIYEERRPYIANVNWPRFKTFLLEEQTLKSVF